LKYKKYSKCRRLVLNELVNVTEVSYDHSTHIDAFLSLTSHLHIMKTQKPTAMMIRKNADVRPWITRTQLQSRLKGT